MADNLIYNLDINNRAFKAIKEYRKKVEIRVTKINDGFDYSVLKENNCINFVSYDKEEMLCLIKKIKWYKTIEDLLTIEGTKYTLSSTDDFDQGVKSIKSFDGYIDGMKKNGVYAIHIEPILDIEEYYKAYDKRYKQNHDLGLLWEKFEPTNEIYEVIRKYNIGKNDKILEIGCGEGRDAISLLSRGYDLLALDYSINAINKCKELSNYKFNNQFINFDIMTSNLDREFDFIYSICVLHMFVLKKHRDRFLQFINEHLSRDGIALIVVMGDGDKVFESNIKDSFKTVRRVNINVDKEMDVIATSCKVVNWEQLNSEISDSKLNIIEQWISERVPGFEKTMCVIVRK